jgi:hypothetical protein
MRRRRGWVAAGDEERGYHAQLNQQALDVFPCVRDRSHEGLHALSVATSYGTDNGPDPRGPAALVTGIRLPRLRW